MVTTVYPLYQSIMSKWDKLVFKINKLGCPLIIHMKTVDSIVGESELRYSLIEWLFQRYNPEWTKEREKTLELELSRLCKLANALGLCHVNDITVLKGNCTPKRNFVFIESFVELIWLKEKYSGSSLDTQHSRDIQFMNRVASGNVFKAQDPQLLVNRIVPMNFNNRYDINNLMAHCKRLENGILSLKNLRVQVPEEVYDFDLIEEQNHYISQLLVLCDESMRFNREIEMTQNRKKRAQWNAELTHTVSPLLDSCKNFQEVMRSYREIHKLFSKILDTQVPDFHPPKVIAPTF